MAGLKRGKMGTPTPSVETTPAQRKRTAKARKKQERHWAAQSGPLRVRFADAAERAGPTGRGKGPSLGEGIVQQAIATHIAPGSELRTPIGMQPFWVAALGDDGMALLLGRSQARTVIPWGCLEAIPFFLRGRGWTRISGSGYSTEIAPDTLDGFLKGWINRATAGWVAVVLEQAGIVEIDRGRPAMVRLRRP